MSQKHKQIPKKQYKIPTPRVDIPESKTRYPIKVKESYLNQLIERSKDKLVFSFEKSFRLFNISRKNNMCSRQLFTEEKKERLEFGGSSKGHWYNKCLPVATRIRRKNNAKCSHSL